MWEKTGPINKDSGIVVSSYQKIHNTSINKQ